MNSYSALAPWYDLLTKDVPYPAFADLYEEEFRRAGGEFKLLLDLGCGTGAMLLELGRRGYEMIGADSSVEMLMEAAGKLAELPVQPILLHQSAEELDLYGTVDAAFCTLDGMNYVPPKLLPEVFRRLHLFVRPGGLVLFDVRLPNWFHAQDGQVFVDEVEGDEGALLCLWRADFDETKNALVYEMDLFSSKGRLWRREHETHIEYAHEPETLCRLLEEAGFRNLRLRSDGPQGKDGRLQLVAVRA